MPIDLMMPVHLITGAECIGKNAKALAGLGKRCLIVTGHSGAKRSGALDAVTQALDAGGIEHAVYSGVAPNPTVESCLAAGRMAAEFGADFVVGIGGGSALDAAKAAGAAAANPDMDESGLYSRVWQNAPKPVVLVGTTSGTGSEVTQVAVLTDSSGRKHSIHDPRLYAAISFGDARFTMSAPPRVTATTGIDALAHCVESYFSRKADELSRLFAVEGIRLFLKNAAETQGFAGELSYARREALYTASIMGGLAINTTGTVFPHTMGYLLTERFGIPHGFASAAFMPALLSGAAEHMPEYTAEFFTRIGCGQEEFMRIYAAVMPALDIRMTREEITAALPRFKGNGSFGNTAYDVDEYTAEEILTRNFL